MSGLSELGTSALINGLTCVGFLVTFSFLKNQPMNSRVYFPAWYRKGHRVGEASACSTRLRKYLNLDVKSYLHAFDWVKACYRMPESELIEHAGLDAVVFLRVFVVGLKIFLPVAFYCFLILVPINHTDNGLETYRASHADFVYTDLDKLTIANVNDGSRRLWAHLMSAYLFTAWTCLVLYIELQKVVALRFQFLASQPRRPDEFTILVRQVPKDKDESLSLQVEHFFRVNHPEHYGFHQVVYNAGKLAGLLAEKDSNENKLVYLEAKYRKSSKRPTRRMGFLHLFGEEVDRIDELKAEITRLSSEIAEERRNVLQNTDHIMPAAFVTFLTRWGAAVCAQTQQTRDATTWLTHWAPEPRDVYWPNLAIPYVSLSSRKVGTRVVVFFVVVFFMFPVTFVQSMANLDGIEKKVPFLKFIVKQKFINSVLQGFLPGLSLKIFLLIIPFILMILSKIEGHVSRSKLDLSTSGKYFLVMVVNVFLGNVIVGTAFQQLKQYVEAPPAIPSTLGKAIPSKAIFFMTYIMVDGWSSLAGELLRLFPLLIFQAKAAVFLRTEKDLDDATPAGNVCYETVFPQLGLYFLLGLVYSTSSPLILPFLIFFFAFGHMTYRHQIINVYEPEYETAASFWPHIHHRIIASLIIMQITLVGLFSIKKAPLTTPFLLPLPCITLLFFWYCRNKFEPAFRRYPLQEAKVKDTLERRRKPLLDPAVDMVDAYMDPALKAACDEVGIDMNHLEEGNADGPPLVPIRKRTRTPDVSQDADTERKQPC